MFDVFYFGEKPNVLPHERYAANEEEASLLCRTKCFWIINERTNYTGFDFSWEPKPWEIHQRHAFPSQWQKDSGTYLVPHWGWTDTNYQSGMSVSTLPVSDNWEIPDGIGIEDFDFSWHPDPTDPPMIYQFGTQWQRTGGPRYIVPGATQVKYVTQEKARTKPVAAGIVFINHGNVSYSKSKESIRSPLPIIKETRFFESYKDTLMRVVRSIDAEYIWVCSSVCDYSHFDFSWHPSTWQAFMLHVFPSNEQKFGDTFFIHVPTFRERADKVALLDWYDLNFVTEITVPRYEPQTYRHTESSHVNPVKQCASTEPIVLFQNADYSGVIPTVPLWSPKTRAITPLTKAGTSVLVPRSAFANIKTQLWDYPHVDRKFATTVDKPLDIVYISNGESVAERNWEWLNECVAGKDNKIHRVDSVKGRVAAYQAAANASGTPWFFAVFAKLQVSQSFDWGWQADCLQQAKNYVFYAKNPVNGLVYGHQAMIAYNKELVLRTTSHGLDFTLSSAHDVVPVVSGIAHFNTDPWTTWRTAFREVLKLKTDSASFPTDISNNYRLKIWLSKAEGQNASWCLAGAADAIEYYSKVNGNMDDLMLSFDWEWLGQYFRKKYFNATSWLSTSQYGRLGRRIN